MARGESLRRRRGRKAAVSVLRQLPRFLRLIVRLLRDPRVSRMDKALLGLVVAYVVSPLDLIPDVFAVIGLSDDVFLLGLALNRLLANAGEEVLLEHWDGNPRALKVLLGGIEDVGAMLPRRVRQALRSRVEED